MHYRELENCILFQNIPADEIENASQHRTAPCERVFRLMEPALQIGILLSGKVEVQKTFERGSRINVSVRGPGELIGPAAAFSDQKRYPCDIIALEPTSILMFHNQDLLQLLQRDIRILESFTAQIASTTYMLQQRLELFSYSGIAQKAAFYLLMQMRQSGKCTVRNSGNHFRVGAADECFPSFSAPGAEASFRSGDSFLQAAGSHYFQARIA